jgi:hypothetical protein
MQSYLLVLTPEHLLDTEKRNVLPKCQKNFKVRDYSSLPLKYAYPQWSFAEKVCDIFPSTELKGIALRESLNYFRMKLISVR